MLKHDVRLSSTGDRDLCHPLNDTMSNYAGHNRRKALRSPLPATVVSTAP